MVKSHFANALFGIHEWPNRHKVNPMSSIQQMAVFTKSYCPFWHSRMAESTLRKRPFFHSQMAESTLREWNFWHSRMVGKALRECLFLLLRTAESLFRECPIWYSSSSVFGKCKCPSGRSFFHRDGNLLSSLSLSTRTIYGTTKPNLHGNHQTQHVSGTESSHATSHIFASDVAHCKQINTDKKNMKAIDRG
jgi:hypothetical protein